MGEMKREELEAVFDEMDEVFASRDLQRLKKFRKGGAISSWNGGTPTGNVISAIQKACDEAAKGVWDHPLKNEARRALEREFPEQSIEPTTASHEGDAEPKVR